MSGTPPATATEKRFPCKNCGAKLAFAPGTQHLKCEYCGFENEIPQSAEEIQELDFHEYLDIARQESVADTQQTVKCSACAAEFTARGDAVSDSCPFCGSHSILAIPAIRARVYQEESWFDGRNCIVLDYSQTSRICRWVRDEIREVDPGLYLGLVYGVGRFFGGRRLLDVTFALSFSSASDQ